MCNSLNSVYSQFTLAINLSAMSVTPKSGKTVSECRVLISGFTATPTPSSRWRRRTHSTTASGLILSARQVICHGVSDRHLQKLKTELFGPLAAVFALFCPIHIDLYGPFRFGHIQNGKTLRNVVSFRLPCVSEGYNPPPNCS